jgi:hypothetical protein
MSHAPMATPLSGTRAFVTIAFLPTCWRRVASIALLLVLSAPQLWAAPVTALGVEVRTADVTFGGTDNDVTLVLLVQQGGNPPQQLRWNLDSGIDDFESGSQDTYALTDHLPADTCNIVGIAIEKSEDDFDGGWKLDWFRVIINGAEFYRGNANDWLEDDNLSWWAPDFVSSACEPGFSFGGNGPIPPPLPNCTVNTGSSEFPAPKPDADCDMIPDDVDTEFNPPDKDKDGLPDRTEDWNGNGVVDPGESDPNTPTKLSDLPDADGDGLPDLFEDRDRDGVVDVGETDKNNPDTDADGWADGPKNVRTRLFLVQVHCKNSSEDTELGDDETFVTFNHARWPDDDDLDGYWEMGGDSAASPMIEAARRTRGMAPVGAFRVRVDLREDDWFDWTDDDFEVDHDHVFPENGLSQWNFLDDGWFNTIEYELKFISVSQMFADPNPLVATSDDDADGLTEKQESQLSADLMGVGDVTVPDIYMELDVLGKDQEPERYSKEDIVSRFTQRHFAFHLDDGTFGGGEILPYQEHFTLTKAVAQRGTNVAAARMSTFHYAVGVNVPQDDSGNNWNGKALRVKKASNGAWLSGNGNTLIWKTDYLDHLTDFESIVWIHEFGHNLGLCHRPGDGEANAVGPTGSGCAVGSFAGDCNCTHYTVSSSSDTAMGSAIGFLFYDAVDRETDYDPAEWPVIDLRQVSRP